jgi:uncharacterized protein YbcC (UPF0753/DUF2309 family)
MTRTTFSTSDFSTLPGVTSDTLLSTMRRAGKKIAPVWPLENFVAVNPYLGLIDRTFESVALDLAAAGNVQMTLPESFYLEKIKQGEIRKEDIAQVLQRKQRKISATEFLRSLTDTDLTDDDSSIIRTVADIATEVSKKNWNRFVLARVSNWAASYFDKGQAIWATADKKKSPFHAWKEEAELDLTPELTGLGGFRKCINSLPNDPLEAAQVALSKLTIPQTGVDIYLHSLLLRTGGWSAYAAQLDWENELHGGQDGNLIEFLAILLCWEVSLLNCIKSPELKNKWKGVSRTLANATTRYELQQKIGRMIILQEAFDVATQRALISKFNSQKAPSKTLRTQVKAQAIFCIDVRSEVFRRNLEQADNAVETLGFAGFFAFPIKYLPIGHETGENQCPVLLKTGPTILAEMPDKDENDRAWSGRILNRHTQQVFKSFKSGAVSCFSFVSPLGLSYLPKLFTDSFGITRPVPQPDKVGLKRKYSDKMRISLNHHAHHAGTAGIRTEDQIQMAKNALKAMSLTDDFAKLVLIVGHGSTMVNNPHQTGYDCGACGGHTGESNAKVAAAVLNSRDVRAGLQQEDIFIPVNTVFLACLHDTTTDEVKIFNEYDLPEDRQVELEDLKDSLKKAGRATRSERSARLTPDYSKNADKAIMTRSKDWSQTRPEWGLAGCCAFVVAPRNRSQGIDLEGRSFLHSYDWKNDDDFKVLELIMTAPMVVTSWINLQYYASTVDNRVYGSGNKTLHNVTAGIGVLEGYSGDLRVGLPWQAVYDGRTYQHEPVRLNVIIEAPLEAMNKILEKHKVVKDLCDNGWVQLLAMDQQGNISHRYEGDFTWERIALEAA